MKEQTLNSEEINYLSNKKKKQNNKNNNYTSIVNIFLLILISISLLGNLFIFLNFFFFKKYNINNNGFNNFHNISNNNYNNNINNFNNNYKDKNNQIMDFSNPPLETIDLIILESVKDNLQGFIELNLDEQRFLNGIIRKIYPKKIIEIGVSYGGTSTLILNAIKDIEGANLYSIELSKICSKNIQKSSGYIVQEKFPYFILLF